MVPCPRDLMIAAVSPLRAEPVPRRGWPGGRAGAPQSCAPGCSYWQERPVRSTARACSPLESRRRSARGAGSLDPSCEGQGPLKSPELLPPQNPCPPLSTPIRGSLDLRITGDQRIPAEPAVGRTPVATPSGRKPPADARMELEPWSSWGPEEEGLQWREPHRVMSSEAHSRPRSDEGAGLRGLYGLGRGRSRPGASARRRPGSSGSGCRPRFWTCGRPLPSWP